MNKAISEFYNGEKEVNRANVDFLVVQVKLNIVKYGVTCLMGSVANYRFQDKNIAEHIIKLKP